MTYDVHIRELLQGSFTVFVLKIAAAGLGFLLNVVLARSLGADGIGLFFLAMILVSIAATLGQFGTIGALVRFVSAAAVNQNWSEVKGVYKQAFMLSFGLSFFLSLSLFFSAHFIAYFVFNNPDMEHILQLMSLAVVPFTAVSIHAASLQGLKKISQSTIVVGILIPVFTLLGCAFLLSENGVFGVSVAYVLATLLTMLISLLLWHYSLSEHKYVVAHFERSVLLKSSMPLFGADIFNLLLMWGPTLFLALWHSESDVGIFQTANRVAMLTSFILVAVNSIFAPKLSECFVKNDNQLAFLIIKKSTGLMLFMAIPIVFIMFFFAKEIMSIFGEDFIQGKNILMILAFAQFVNVVTGSVGQILIMSGNEMKLQKAFMITAICSLFINFFLIQEFGLIGAALSSAIGVIMVKLLATFFVFRHVKLDLFHPGKAI